MAAKAQLGLGHSYSRAKVKFNVHRVDNMIIQSISLLDQLDKDINTFSMRIRYIQYLFLFWVCILWLNYAAYHVEQIMQVHLWAEALSGFVLYDQISVHLIFLNVYNLFILQKYTPVVSKSYLMMWWQAVATQNINVNRSILNTFKDQKEKNNLSM